MWVCVGGALALRFIGGGLVAILRSPTGFRLLFELCYGYTRAVVGGWNVGLVLRCDVCLSDLHT